MNQFASIHIISDIGNNSIEMHNAIGLLYKNIPNARIIAENHAIHASNVEECAVVLNCCLDNFPQHTIHICNLIKSKKVAERFIVLHVLNQFIFTLDNGLLSHLKFPVNGVYRIPFSMAFPNYMSDIFIPEIKKLIDSEYTTTTLTKTDSYLQFNHTQLALSNNQLFTKVVYLDSQGNGYLNIDKKTFTEIIGNKKFAIRFSRRIQITSISPSPNAVDPEDTFACFNNIHYLMIGIHSSSAKQYLGLELDKTIIIEIKE